MNINQILIKPQITEKAMAATGSKTYCFQVDVKANKHQICQAVETIFKVKVISVRTSIRQGKIRKVGKRMKLKQLPDKKIAYITIKEGNINLFPTQPK